MPEILYSILDFLDRREKEAETPAPSRPSNYWPGGPPPTTKLPQPQQTPQPAPQPVPRATPQPAQPVQPQPLQPQPLQPQPAYTPAPYAEEDKPEPKPWDWGKSAKTQIEPVAMGLSEDESDRWRSPKWWSWIQENIVEPTVGYVGDQLRDPWWLSQEEIDWYNRQPGARLIREDIEARRQKDLAEVRQFNLADAVAAALAPSTNGIAGVRLPGPLPAAANVAWQSLQAAADQPEAQWTKPLLWGAERGREEVFGIPGRVTITTPLDEASQVIAGKPPQERGTGPSIAQLIAPAGATINRAVVGSIPILAKEFNVKPLSFPVEARQKLGGINMWTALRDIAFNIYKEEYDSIEAVENRVRLLPEPVRNEAELVFGITSSGGKGMTRALDHILNREPILREKTEQRDLAILQGNMEDAARLGAEVYDLENQTAAEIVMNSMVIPADFLMEWLFDYTNLVGPLLKLAGLTQDTARVSRAKRMMDISESKSVDNIISAARKLDPVVQAIASGENPNAFWARVFRAKEIDGWGAALREGTWLYARTPASNADMNTNRLWKAATNLLNGYTDKDELKMILRMWSNPNTRADMVRGFNRGGKAYKWGAGLIGNEDVVKAYPGLDLMNGVFDGMRSLAGEGPVNPYDFLSELAGILYDGSRRAEGIAGITRLPFGAKDVNLRTLPSGQAVIDYVDDAGNVLQRSVELSTAEAARRIDIIKGAKTKGAGEIVYDLAKIPADVQRAIMSDMWLALRPANWIRNATSAAGMLLGQDAFTFTRTGDIVDDLAKKFAGAGPTMRMEDIRAGKQGLAGLEVGSGAIAKVSKTALGKDNPISRIMAKIYQIPYGSAEIPLGGLAIPVGEQAFYSRAFYVPFQRTLRRTWKEMVRTDLGPKLDNLGVSPQIKKTIIDAVIDEGIKGNRWSIKQAGQRVASAERLTDSLRALEIPDELISLEGWRRIERAVGDALPDQVEDVTRTIRRIFDQEREAVADILRAAPPQPNPEWTKVRAATDAGDIIDNMVDAGVRAGMDAAEAQKRAVEVAREWVERQEAAWELFTRELAQSQSLPGVWDVAADFWQDMRSIREAARHDVDDASRAAIRANTRDAWQTKWNTNERVWSRYAGEFDAVVEKYRGILSSLGEGGEYVPKHPWWDTVKRYVEWDEVDLERAAGVALGKPSIGDEEKFRSMIEAYRGYADHLMAVMLESFKRYPDVDNYDIMIDALRRADHMGAQVASFLKERRATLLPERAAEYYKLRNQAWREYFGQVLPEYIKGQSRAIIQNGLDVRNADVVRWTDDITGHTMKLVEPLDDGAFVAVDVVTGDIHRVGGADGLPLPDEVRQRIGQAALQRDAQTAAVVQQVSDQVRGTLPISTPEINATVLNGVSAQRIVTQKPLTDKDFWAGVEDGLRQYGWEIDWTTLRHSDEFSVNSVGLKRHLPEPFAGAGSPPQPPPAPVAPSAPAAAARQLDERAVASLWEGTSPSGRLSNYFGYATGLGDEVPEGSDAAKWAMREWTELPQNVKEQVIANAGMNADDVRAARLAREGAPSTAPIAPEHETLLREVGKGMRDSTEMRPGETIGDVVGKSTPSSSLGEELRSVIDAAVAENAKLRRSKQFAVPGDKVIDWDGIEWEVVNWPPGDAVTIKNAAGEQHNLRKINLQNEYKRILRRGDLPDDLREAVQAFEFELSGQTKGIKPSQKRLKEARAVLDQHGIAEVEPVLSIVGGEVDYPVGAVITYKDGRVVSYLSMDKGDDYLRELYEAATKTADAVTDVTKLAAPQVTNADLRKAAAQVEIGTMTEKGVPYDNHLVNAINKDLGIRIEKLDDLTDEQRVQALAALEKRYRDLQGAEETAEAAVSTAMKEASEEVVKPAKAVEDIKPVMEVAEEPRSSAEREAARIALGEGAETATEAVTAYVEPELFKSPTWKKIAQKEAKIDTLSDGTIEQRWDLRLHWRDRQKLRAMVEDLPGVQYRDTGPRALFNWSDGDVHYVFDFGASKKTQNHVRIDVTDERIPARAANDMLPTQAELAARAAEGHRLTEEKLAQRAAEKPERLARMRDLAAKAHNAGYGNLIDQIQYYTKELNRADLPPELRTELTEAYNRTVDNLARWDAALADRLRSGKESVWDILETPKARPTMQDLAAQQTKPAGQANMFAETGEDLPLMSGQAPRPSGAVEEFKPTDVARQEAMFDMRPKMGEGAKKPAEELEGGLPLLEAAKPTKTPKIQLRTSTVAADAKDEIKAIEEAMDDMRRVWDDYSARHGFGSRLDSYANKYKQSGFSESLETTDLQGKGGRFADVVGSTLGGQPINSVQDIMDFFRQYDQLRTRRKLLKSTIADTRRFVKMDAPQIIETVHDDLLRLGMSEQDIANLARQDRTSVLDFLDGMLHAAETMGEGFEQGTYFYSGLPLVNVFDLLGLSRNEGPLHKQLWRALRRSRGRGGIQTPEIGDIARHNISTLDDAEEAIIRALPNLMSGQPNTLTNGQRRRIMEMIDGMMPRYDDALGMAVEVGERTADWAMLNFNDRRHFDQILALLYPYHYFWSRMPSRMAMLALTKPSFVNAYYAGKQAIERENRQEGVPLRLQGTVPVPGIELAGQKLRAGLDTWLDNAIPFGMYIQPNPFVEPNDAVNDVDKWIRRIEQWTPGMFPANEMFLDWLRGDLDKWQMGDFLPIPRLVNYANMARTGNIGGPSILRLGEEYDYGRIGRELVSIAYEQGISPELAQYAMDIGWQILQQTGPLPEQPERAQKLFEQGVKRMGLNRGVALLGSWLIGMGIYPYPEGEKELRQAADTRRKLGYDETKNIGGSKEAVQAFDESMGGYMPLWFNYPNMYPQTGESTYTGETRPGILAARSELKAAQDKIYEQYQKNIEDWLAKHPNADWKVFSTYKDQQQAIRDEALKQVEAQYPSAALGKKTDWSTVDIYKTMSPDELNQAAVDNAIRQAQDELRDARPGDGATGKQWDAYNAMVAKRAQEILAAEGSELVMGHELGGSQVEDAARRLGVDLSTVQRPPLPGEADMTQELERYLNRYTPQAEQEFWDRWEQVWARENAEWEARKAGVVSVFGGEAGALYEQYLALPRGEARQKFKAQNPILRAVSLYTWNPDEYQQIVNLFGEGAIEEWAHLPAWENTDAAGKARSAYYDQYPRAFLVNAWLYGRPASRDETEVDEDSTFSYDFGADFEEAKGLFGEDIWNVVAGYKRAWDKKTKAAYYDAHPNLSPFFDWWYGEMDQETSTARSSAYAPRSYSYYGGYGGGGSSWEKPKYVDRGTPRQVYMFGAREMQLPMPYTRREAWRAPSVGSQWRSFREAVGPRS